MPDPATPTAEHPRIPPGVALAVAVAGVSWAAPIIRLSRAPALALSAWRLLLSLAFIGAVLVVRGSALGGVRLGRRDGVLAVAAGLLLAGHFWSWIASVDLTTVASSVVLVSTQPFIVAVLSALFLGEHPTRRQWAGIAVAVAGAAVIGRGDVALGPRALTGDLLAFAAAWLVAGYYVVGRRLRRRLDLWAYTGLVYGVAALALTGVVLLAPGVPLTGYPPREWLLFLALAAGPMMLGHTGVNYALRWVPAYVANLALLGEAVGATLLAWALPGIRETPPPATLVGGALILAGIALGSAPRGRPSPGGLDGAGDGAPP